MRPQSCKAKGRKFQQEVRDAILAKFPSLLPDDVRSASMGASGEDILLSSSARGLVPFSIEVKNVERLNIHDAIKQASARATPQYPPLVVFRKNHTPPHVVLPFDVFLDMLKDLSLPQD